ncbi:hypothetical protein T484DRAFT_1776112 [Baffinella frigidus]|nr:hypothetical protein T484DRAFT_1776112 [Cryptophyta sp. CCMP2293]
MAGGVSDIQEFFAAVIVADAAYWIIRGPAETLKTRIQTGEFRKRLDRDLAESVQKMTAGGWGATRKTLWGAFFPLLLADVPFVLMNFALFSALQAYVVGSGGEWDTWAQFTGGFMCSATTAFVTCPISVATTRIMILQGQETKKGGVLTVSPESLKLPEDRSLDEAGTWESEWAGSRSHEYGLLGSEWEEEEAHAEGVRLGPKRILASAVKRIQTAAEMAAERVENSRLGQLGSAVKDGNVAAALAAGGAFGGNTDTEEDAGADKEIDISLVSTVIRIYKEEGIVPLFNGWVPRVLQLGLSHAVRFTAYGASRGFVVGEMLTNSDLSTLFKIF